MASVSRGLVRATGRKLGKLLVYGLALLVVSAGVSFVGVDTAVVVLIVFVLIEAWEREQDIQDIRRRLNRLEDQHEYSTPDDPREGRLRELIAEQRRDNDERFS